MIDIIFLWDSSIHQNNDVGVLLSGKYNVKSDLRNHSLVIQKNEGYVEGFWGENVKDCFAIVGDNGAGKTMLVNCIMNDINIIKHSKNYNKEFLIVFEDKIKECFCVYCTPVFEDINIKVYDGMECCKKLIGKGNRKNKYLSEYEIVYFHNALSKHDYYVDKRCEYDFSLGKMIRKHHNTTYEQHYDDLYKDVIRNYYDNDAFRIIIFLYDFAIHNDLNIEFPLPKNIGIQIADEHYNEKYIMGEAKKICVDKDQEEKLSQEVEEFRRGVDNIIKIFGRSWINCTIKNLLLNCFNELCIPSTVPSTSLH